MEAYCAFLTSHCSQYYDQQKQIRSGDCHKTNTNISMLALPDDFLCGEESEPARAWNNLQDIVDQIGPMWNVSCKN